MPESKNRKFFWLNYGESIRFKLVDVENKIKQDSGSVYIEKLSDPIRIHVSPKPFPSGRKSEPCVGTDRCPYCQSKNNPQTKYPVHVLAYPNEPTEHEYIMDMSISAHDAVCREVQTILDRGGTVTDVHNTVFTLERLAKSTKPYFICRITADESNEILVSEEEIEKISDEDIIVLKRISNAVASKNLTSPRGSVIKTLREKYHWADSKIELALATVLDENGLLKGDSG